MIARILINSAMLIAVGVYLFLGNSLFTWILKAPTAHHLFGVCLLHVFLGTVIYMVGFYRLEVLGFSYEHLVHRIFLVILVLGIFGLPIYKAWAMSTSLVRMILYLWGCGAIVFSLAVIIVMFRMNS